MPKKTTTRHTEKNNNSSPGTGRKFMNIDHPKIQSAAANGKILLNFTGLEAMATAIERLRNLYSSTPIRWVDGKFAVPAGFTMADDLAEKLTSVEQKIRWCQTFTPFQLAEDSKTGPIFTAPGTLVLADGYVIPVPHRYAYCNAADGGVVTLGPPEFGAAGCCRLTSTLAIKCRGKGKPVWFPPCPTCGVTKFSDQERANAIGMAYKGANGRLVAVTGFHEQCVDSEDYKKHGYVGLPEHMWD